MDNCSIFISSADTYSDLWPMFFDLFKKYWPAYMGEIYLNTETKTFHYEGLNIKCTNVGNLGSFGKTFRAGLDKVNSDNVLLIMIDYLFIEKVDVELLKDYYEYFSSNSGLDSLCLVENPYTNTEELNHKKLKIVVPPSKDMFSYQIAFWKKTTLFKMALPHENPWMSEWYGTKRANLLKIKLAFATGNMVIPYLAEGALHKGKWVTEMIGFLDSINYTVDFLKRGIFKEEPVTFKYRIKERRKTFSSRILSNIDLIKRKLIK